MDPQYETPSPAPRARHSPKHFGAPKVTECASDRQLVLPDGTKKCANCADCPKKKTAEDGNPKVKVQVDAVAAAPGEVDFTAVF